MFSKRFVLAGWRVRNNKIVNSRQFPSVETALSFLKTQSKRCDFCGLVFQGEPVKTFTSSPSELKWS
jgi:hypothetical protein